MQKEKISFFKRFEAIMNKYFVPLAHKIDQQPHLSSIKAGMVAMMPFTILGSFFAILPSLPNMLSKENYLSQFLNNHAALLALPVQFSIGLIGLYACIAIAVGLGNRYKLYIPGCVTLSVFSFLFLAATLTDEGALELTNLGARGLFTGMLAALVTVELYALCKRKNLTIRLPDGVPDFVSKSFELIPTTLLVAGAFITLRVLSLQFFNELPPAILTRFLSPLVGSMDNPWAVLILNICICLVFFFGIHPSVFSPITGPIRTTFIAENILAFQAGVALPHFYTDGTVSAFSNFTGTGVTIGLVVAALISKTQRYRKIGRISLFPSLFGINEPALFGMPVILNPMMFIPFVFGGAIIGTLPMFLMHWGWLNKSVFTPPYVGVFLEGFLTNGDWRSIVVNFCQALLSFLFYWPFFKILERQELQLEQSAPANNIFSKDDEKLIEDMQLDF